MNSTPVIIHSGALGDLALFVKLMLRMPGVADTNALTLASRISLGRLREARPSIDSYSTESLGLHRLFAVDGRPPDELIRLVRDRVVVHNLGDVESDVHRHLAALPVRCTYGIDPRCRGGQGHITTQWETNLNRQGLLLTRCAGKRRGGETVSLPDFFVQHGRTVLERNGLSEPGRPRTLIHVGSGGLQKCWPMENFADLAQMLIDRGQPIAFVIGPAEQERVPAAILDRLRAVAPLLALTEIDDLLGVMSHASLWIGNDAGPGHLAALIGVPTLTLFGPTSAVRWRPLGAEAQIVQGKTAVGLEWGIPVTEVIDQLLSHNQIFR